MRNKVDLNQQDVDDDLEIFYNSNKLVEPSLQENVQNSAENTC